MDLESDLDRAADAIQQADAVLIGAGAGMGVDSGLPDFRGDQGFWKAYPPFKGRRFSDLSTPHWFTTDPQLAWGFFGHRYHLYSRAIPHAGFRILSYWMKHRFADRYFVFTSNVDGQFQKAGFPEERILERHGSIHHLQCTQPCHLGIWPAGDLQIEVDAATIRSRSKPPTCPKCGQIARPNILMFNDWDWLTSRTEEQLRRYQAWQSQHSGANVVALEFGAGLAIPTVRIECEDNSRTHIRINPRESQTGSHGIPIPLGALDALTRLEARLKWLGSETCL